MSNSVDTKDTTDTQTPKPSEPAVSVKRSISWGSEVRGVREGGMKIGTNNVPKKISERTPDASSEEDEGQDDGSDGEERDGQTQTRQSQVALSTKAGSVGTGSAVPRSTGTASKDAVSGLPSEAGMSPSQWGNK